MRHGLHIVGASVLVAGCGIFGGDETARTTDTLPTAQHQDVLSADGTEYAVSFTSHGIWRDANGGAGADVAVPQVRVARTDGTALTEDDIMATRGVAKAYCRAHPEFRREVVFGDGVAVEQGSVIFSEICD